MYAAEQGTKNSDVINLVSILFQRKTTRTKRKQQPFFKANNSSKFS